jgi:hypothetical protein
MLEDGLLVISDVDMIRLVRSVGKDGTHDAETR